MFNSFNIKFTRNQRIGILLLFTIIIVLQFFIYFFHSDKKIISNTNISKELMAEYDSLKQKVLLKQNKIINPFNPNYLSESKAYYLGIDLQSLDKINEYRQKGKYFRSKQQFKQISGISDSLYKILEPYIEIPSYKKFEYSFKNKTYTTKNINKAIAPDFENISGIGKILSKRIIKYRDALGGFVQKQQIYKVYGLDKETADKIWQVFYISKQSHTKNAIKEKIDINSATDNDLKKVFGIGEKLSHRIIKYRKKIGGFTIKEQLNYIYGLSPEAINKLWEHFDIKNPKKIKQKINLNEANIIELAKNPYIDYSLAKQIVSYRTLHGAFENFDALKKVKQFPVKKLKVICLYLKIN